MRNFKIVFYKSELGELIKIKEFYREAAAIHDLVANPPEEFFEMLDSFSPVHGWAELDKTSSTIYVIFAPRGKRLQEIENTEFLEWLESVSPADFNEVAD